MATANYRPESVAAQAALNQLEVINDLRDVQGELAYYESNPDTNPPEYDGSVFRNQENLNSYLQAITANIEVEDNFLHVEFQSEGLEHVGLLARRNKVYHLYYSHRGWHRDGAVELDGNDFKALMWFCAMVSNL